MHPINSCSLPTSSRIQVFWKRMRMSSPTWLRTVGHPKQVSLITLRIYFWNGKVKIRTSLRFKEPCQDRAKYCRRISRPSMLSENFRIKKILRSIRCKFIKILNSILANLDRVKSSWRARKVINSPKTKLTSQFSTASLQKLCPGKSIQTRIKRKGRRCWQSKRKIKIEKHFPKGSAPRSQKEKDSKKLMTISTIEMTTF